MGVVADGAAAWSGKKAPTGAPSACARWCNREAEMRLAPLSYFCSCWKLTPMRPARAAWDRPSACRRAEMRAPT
jgi:hypothetical protein